jgi:hypothetical protein
MHPVMLGIFGSSSMGWGRRRRESDLLGYTAPE